MGITLPQLLESLSTLGQKHGFEVKDITDDIRVPNDLLRFSSSPGVLEGKMVLLFRNVKHLHGLFQLMNATSSIKSRTRVTLALIYKDNQILTYFNRAKTSLQEVLRADDTESCQWCGASVAVQRSKSLDECVDRLVRGQLPITLMRRAKGGSPPLRVIDGNVLFPRGAKACFHYLCPSCRTEATRLICTAEDPFALYCRECRAR